MEQKESREDQLREILQNNSSLLKLASQVMARTEKERPEKTSARTWRSARVVSKCLHCGSEHSRDVKLEQKESFCYTRRNGKVCIVTFKMLDEPLTVVSTTVFCPDCRSFIEALDRSELEERYLHLLELNLSTARKLFEAVQRPSSSEEKKIATGKETTK